MSLDRYTATHTNYVFGYIYCKTQTMCLDRYTATHTNYVIGQIYCNTHKLCVWIDILQHTQTMCLDRYKHTQAMSWDLVLEVLHRILQC